MTLNGVIALLVNYVTVVEDRPEDGIGISTEYPLPLLAKTNPACGAVSLR